MVGDRAEARAFLLCKRASLHAAMGKVSIARDTLLEVKALLGTDPSPRLAQQYQSTATMLDCVSLNYDAMAETMDRVHALGRDRESMYAWFEMSWLIPLILSSTDPRVATPWSRQLRMETERVHPWRHADALTFEYMLANATGDASVPNPIERVRQSQNWLAHARLLVVMIRSSLLRRDLTGTSALVEEVTGLIPRAVPAARGTWAGFAALLDAYSLPDRRVVVEIPTEVSIENLGATLASMEAVAIAGSQADAIAWLAAARRLLPAGASTSLEWPVSVDRMMGLLLLRAGDHRGAARSLKAAADWSRGAGYLIEEALARLQLGELATHVSVSIGERRVGSLRERAWNDLVALGIDPAFQAYVASHVAGRGRGGDPGSMVTPRETEVLRLLARGNTYREAAETLGVTWKTVQSHAYRAYGKLGAARKFEAVQTAQRMGII